ncbi:MAG: amino acid ABC transporter permease [Chloroflexi bacterium]|nr:amino acid ABC transporter permease [Chloroflexota bacterium]
MPDADLSATKKSLSAQPGRALAIPGIERLPWWIIILIIGGIIAAFVIVTSEDYLSILSILSSGISFTLTVTVFAFLLALVIGLIAGVMRVSTNLVLYTISTLYVEVIRGIPLLVQILYFFYVIAPFFGERTPEPYAQLFRQEVIQGIIALGIGYGAYLAEIYRAGIQAVSRGQIEAARSLGMDYFQTMRLVILPQALRVVLPPLGNDLVSMLKDSSLLSAISVKELTLWTRQRSANTFRPLEHWTMAALLYLVMTLGLSLIVRYLERKLAIPK